MWGISYHLIVFNMTLTETRSLVFPLHQPKDGYHIPLSHTIFALTSLWCMWWQHNMYWLHLPIQKKNVGWCRSKKLKASHIDRSIHPLRTSPIWRFRYQLCVSIILFLFFPCPFLNKDLLFDFLQWINGWKEKYNWKGIKMNQMITGNLKNHHSQFIKAQVQ